MGSAVSHLEAPFSWERRDWYSILFSFVHLVCWILLSILAELNYCCLTGCPGWWFSQKVWYWSLQWNNKWNSFGASPCLALPSSNMVLDVMLLCVEYGEEDSKRYLCMCSILNQINTVILHSNMSKRIWSVSARGWACNLCTTSAVHNRWNGTCCNSILEETHINDSWKGRLWTEYDADLNLHF